METPARSRESAILEMASEITSDNQMIMDAIGECGESLDPAAKILWDKLAAYLCSNLRSTHPMDRELNARAIQMATERIVAWYAEKLVDGLDEDLGEDPEYFYRPAFLRRQAD